jgi:hypothetical protein
MKSGRAKQICIITTSLLLVNCQASFSSNLQTDPAHQSAASAACTTAICEAVPAGSTPSSSQTKTGKAQHRSEPQPILMSKSDPYTPGLSQEALQLCEILHVTDKLEQIQRLQQELEQPDGQRAPIESKQKLADLKVDLLTIIEETRLEIDFVVSEIEEENARFEETLQTFSDERDRRVNKAYNWAFRTNGALWAVAEGLDIPTYSSPRYSIPSGTIGIVAGLVPSLFSAYALRAEGGKRYEKAAFPNMLSKIYGLPTHEGIEYTESVWTYLNSPTPGPDKRTRKEILINHWIDDKNISIFKHGMTKQDLILLTGAEQPMVTIDLIKDRLTMLREVEAVTLQMSRPLLEINMVLQGKKKLAN